MACPACAHSVLFGGVKEGNLRYCSRKCHEADAVGRLASQLPDEEVKLRAGSIHSGHCPICDGAGPVDIYKSYRVYSVVVYTSWRTLEHMACRSCARRAQSAGLVSSFLLGWWGIPFGLAITPVMVVANAVSMLTNSGANGPSKSLEQRTRKIMAAERMQNA